MNPHFSRRSFLKHSLQAGIGLAALGGVAPFAQAIEPIKRTGKPRFLLSLAAYSFRNYFKDSKHPQDAPANTPQRMDLFKFIDYCAEQGCDGAELTSYYFPKDVTTEYLLDIRRHAFIRGIGISGTAVGNNFVLPEGEKRKEQINYVKTWIDNAAVFGAPHIRVFAGPVAKDIDEKQSIALCISALEECCDYAGKKGVFLGLENHGGIVAEAGPLIDIVKAVNSKWLGINLDSGNFHTDDPYGDLARCAPYAVNVQIKPHIRARNEKENSKPDLARIFKILTETNYQGWVALEHEGKEDPWQAVPGILSDMKKFMRA